MRNTIKNKIPQNKGEMDFLIQILLFLVVLFVIWVLTGGQSHETKEKPFIKPLNDVHEPGRTYGPGEKY